MEYWTIYYWGKLLYQVHTRLPGAQWPSWCTPGFLNLILCGRMCVCVCVCAHVHVCPPLRLLITSGVMWIPYDWLNKLYSFNVAAVVSIISRCGLSTKAHHESQPNKRKLALYKPSIHFNSRARQSASAIKMGVARSIPWHLKEKLALAIYKLALGY